MTKGVRAMNLRSPQGNDATRTFNRSKNIVPCSGLCNSARGATYRNKKLAQAKQNREKAINDFLYATDVPESLFSGYVVNYDYNFALGGLNTVSVYCADQFYLLAQTYLDALNPTAETSGQRIETVLDLPEVDFPVPNK